jgi:hypothetical protein
MKNNYICNDCNCQFEITRKHEISDHTGFAGIIIDVCPVCISNDIQETVNLFLPILNSEDFNALQKMASVYYTKCIDAKMMSTDITLLQHYTALIDECTTLVDKIRYAQKKI